MGKKYFYNNPEKRISEKGINIDNIISNQRERRKANLK